MRAIVVMLAIVACAAAMAFAPPIGVLQSLPTVGPSFVDSFSLSCTSAAAVAIVPPSGASMLSYECINESTTMVAVGDSAIADPGTSRVSPVFCAAGGTCPVAAKAIWGGNISKEFCRGDTDTTIQCRAMVATLTPP